MSSPEDRSYPPETKFEPIDLGVGIAGTFLTGATVFAFTKGNENTVNARINEKKLIVVGQQETVTQDASFLREVYSAINDPTYPEFVDSVAFDGKIHQPSPSLAQEKSNRDFNRSFTQFQKDPVIGPTLRQVDAAESAQVANNAIVAEYSVLEAQQASLTAEVARLDRQRPGAEPVEMVALDVVGIVLAGIVAYFASRGLRYGLATRQSRRISKIEAKEFDNEFKQLLELETGKKAETDKLEKPDQSIPHPETQPGD